VKIMLVAMFTTAILHEPLSPALWAAAALSTMAIVLLNASRPKSPHRIGATIALAITAASCYALFDVLVQNWAPAWGTGRFLPIMVTMAAVLTLFLPGRNLPGPHRKWALGGAACLSLQAVFLVSSIAYFRHATTANVLYSSRGLWSVLIVWLVGGRYGWAEAQHTNRVMLWRLAGAVLMIAAIALGVSTR
jgi:drug/metabolite transporter (DMT)-like permease